MDYLSKPDGSSCLTMVKISGHIFAKNSSRTPGITLNVVELTDAEKDRSRMGEKKTERER